MSRHPFSFLVTLGVILGSLVAPRTARAQIPEAVYEDAKLIIEELMNEEVARNVVPQVVCRAGRTRLGPPVPDAQPSKDPVAINLDIKRPGISSPSASWELQLLRFYPRTLQKIYRRQFGTLRVSIAEESAGLVGYRVYQAVLSGATDATLLGLSKLAGIAETNQAEMRQLPGVAATTDTGPEQFAILDESSLETCVTTVANRFKSGESSRVTVTPLEAECERPGKTRQMYACHLGQAVQSALNGKPANAEDHLLQAAVAILYESLSQGTGALDPALLEELIVDVRDLVKGQNAALVTALIDQHVTGAGLPALTAAQKNAIGRLQTQWRVAQGLSSANLDVARFIDLISSTNGALRSLCPAVAPGAPGAPGFELCKALPNQDSILESRKFLWPVIRMASQGQGGDAARLAVRSLFAYIDEKQCERARTKEGCAQTKIYARFAESLVVYVMDVAEGQASSLTARAAFRSAAVDVLSELSEGGGFDRGFWAASLLPEAAIRYSWSANYYNQDGNAGRVVASVTWPNARIPVYYSDLAYMAVKLSAIDLLAPFSELATRTKTVEFEETRYLAYNLIAPRLRVVVGLPSLSKHLALSAGTSLRLAAPFPEGDPRAPTSHVYRRLWDRSEQWPRFLEYNVSAEYVF